ncbi:MAG: hypothetical protein GSR84_09025 [Desulfurococcales archaeon]|nr:hypothetical protein [Desulfurococcales archaeon]
MRRSKHQRSRDREYLISTSWCAMLKREVARRFRAARPGAYPVGDIVVEKKDNGVIFIWMQSMGKEVLVAWGAAWNTGMGYTWRCLDKALARTTLKALAGDER